MITVNNSWGLLTDVPAKTITVLAMHGKRHMPEIGYRDGKRPVNEDHIEFVVKKDGVPNIKSGHPTVRRIALFHYAIKSHEDFSIKLARGSGVAGGRNRTWKFYNDVQRYDV